MRTAPQSPWTLTEASLSSGSVTKKKKPAPRWQRNRRIPTSSTRCTSVQTSRITCRSEAPSKQRSLETQTREATLPSPSIPPSKTAAERLRPPVRRRPSSLLKTRRTIGLTQPQANRPALNNVEIKLDGTQNKYVFDASNTGSYASAVEVNGLGGESISVENGTVIITGSSYTLTVLNATTFVFNGENLVTSVTAASGEVFSVKGNSASLQTVTALP